jgi:hypothetical protein
MIAKGKPDDIIALEKPVAEIGLVSVAHYNGAFSHG